MKLYNLKDYLIIIFAFIITVHVWARVHHFYKNPSFFQKSLKKIKIYIKNGNLKLLENKLLSTTK